MQKRITILDGAMGTMLQAAGLKPGQRPETMSITDPGVVEAIHRRYVDAGAQMILSNTFCANAHKLSGTGFTVEEVVQASVCAALRAAEGKAIVALDIGPVGELLEPLGTLSFDEAYNLFAQMLRAGEKAGAQAVFFETFSDLGELRAGILAARENTKLPVYASMTFEQTGRTFLGCSAGAAAMALDGLGVQAIGLNCSLGPEQAAPILQEMRDYTDLPLILKPNAGLPDPITGGYDTDPKRFAHACDKLASLGAAYIGGCCGTTPEYIAALSSVMSGKEAVWQAEKKHGVCSASGVCAFGQGIRVIGERINPTGKKRFRQALLEGDMNYIAAQAIEQEEAGAQILDVNVGLPGIDEADMMRRAVTAISGVSSLPLQIDSSNPAAIDAGLRAAPGKCLVNSVNASEDSLAQILPIAKKYGAAVVGLTLCGGGLPETAEERVDYARRILNAALKAGIAREDVAIDCLTLTVSAQQEQAAETLKAVRRVRSELGLETVLGVSNISFGLPQRQSVTAAFLAQAIACGLTMPIVNPNQKEIMDTILSCRVLSGEDAGAAAYIAAQAGERNEKATTSAHGMAITLEEAVMKGMKAEAGVLAAQMLMEKEPLCIVEEHLIPALDEVGSRYESQEIFLPQLLNAAAASGEAFEKIRAAMQADGHAEEAKGPLIMATVEGDIHDIGKNIVITVLENYGYRVIDLGRDVPPQCIVDAARKYGAKAVGLSALMTTTVPGMEKTIRLLRSEGVEVPVIVGGAVLTPDYAEKIGADYYAKDAKQCADIVRTLLG